MSAELRLPAELCFESFVISDRRASSEIAASARHPEGMAPAAPAKAAAAEG